MRPLVRTYAALIAVLLATGLAALGKVGGSSQQAVLGVRHSAAGGAAAVADLPARGAPAFAATTASRPELVSPDLVSPEDGVAGARPPRLAHGRGEVALPAGSRPQDRAAQIEGDPATFHWALLVGINDYAGSTRDNVGSYQDAVALRAHLLTLGWRDDHILLVGNRDATRAGIVGGIRWLASKTDDRSIVVFHYSGHEKPFSRDVDGDGEARDVALWASDNALLVDGDLGRELGRVHSARMWLNFAVCRAGGFDDPGTIADGRLVTYSSPESELSYEDPSVRHSVFGYYSIVEGMRDRHADADGDGQATVEEAFAYARPNVVRRTSDRQHPVAVDRVPGGFSLRVPPPPQTGEPERPDPEPSPEPCTILCGVRRPE